jgi:hypothetical protein
MKRIDDRTVELTDAEQVASVTFEGLLDNGKGIYEAVDIIAEHMPDLDPAFLDYLRN